MPDYIEESGMRFIAENAFHIEKSYPYTKLKGSCVKSVEFIRIENRNLLLVEAKTTIANPNNPDVDNRKKFDLEIGEICDKFVHSLNLFSTIRIGVVNEKLPTAFTTDDQLSLVLILVVRNYEVKWCKPVQQKIHEILPKYFTKIWKPEVRVINYATAIKYGIAIISREDPCLT
jgi:hypothetical protein